jgi:hypothetical protein
LILSLHMQRNYTIDTAKPPATNIWRHAIHMNKQNKETVHDQCSCSRRTSRWSFCQTKLHYTASHHFIHSTSPIFLHPSWNFTRRQQHDALFRMEGTMLFFVYLEARLHQEGVNNSQPAQSTWNALGVIFNLKCVRCYLHWWCSTGNRRDEPI